MLRRALKVFSLLLLLALLALAAFPYSETGTRLVARLLSTTDALDIEYGSGTLMSDLHLSRLTYQDEDVVIVARQVSAALVKSCLWRSEICLKYLSGDELDIEVITGKEADALIPDLSPNLFWPLPFVLSSDDARVADIEVSWRGGRMTLARVELAARLFGEDIHISRGSAGDTSLQIYEERIDIDYREALTLPDVDLPVDLRVDQFSLRPFSWDIGGVRADHAEIEVTGEWSRRNLVLQQVYVDDSQWGQGALAGNIIFEPPYRLHASGHIDLLSPPPWRGLAGGRAGLVLSGSFDDLAVELDLCAAVPVQLSGQVNLVSDRRPFQLQLNSGCSESDPDIVLESLPDMASLAGITVESGWSLQATGTTAEQLVHLTAAVRTPWYLPLQLDMKGRHSEGLLELRETRVREAASGGELVASGDLAYSEGMDAAMSLALTDFRLPDGVTPLAGRLSGPAMFSARLDNRDHWQLVLEQARLHGEINELAAAVEGRLVLDEALSLLGSELSVDINATRLQLSAQEKGRPRVELQVSDLSRWLEDAQGQIDAGIDWDRQQDRLILHGRAAQLRVGPVEGREVRLDGYYDLGGDHRFELDLVSAALRLQEAVQQNAVLNLRGTPQQHSARLLTEGAVNMDLSVAGTLEGDDWLGELAPTILTSDAGSWQLQQALPVRFSGAAQQLLLPDHCWMEIDATLCVSDTRVGRHGALALELRGRLEAFNDTLPDHFRLEGPLQANLAASWDDISTTNLTFSLRADGGRFLEGFEGEEEAEFAWEKIGLEYSGTAAAGVLQGLVRREGRDLMTARISMPANRTGDIRGSIDLAELDLRKFQPFIVRLSRLDGLLSGVIDVSGTLDNPALYGEVALRRGSLSLAGNPTLVEDIELAMDFRGDHAQIDGGLQVEESGSDLSGTLDWRESLKLDLHLKGEPKNLLYPPSTVVQVREDIRLELDTQRLRLSGEVAVPKAEVILDQLPQGSVRVSDDVVLVDYSGNPIQSRAATATEIDLAVRLADNVDVSGDGFSARLGGDLFLEQSVDVPLSVQGNLAVSRGRFEALGQRLDIRRGNIAFVGVLSNPALDVQAEREISEDQVTVGVRIGGTLNTPTLEFYSRPALPEMEIMAYIMGGRGIDRDGDSNSLALALAMTSGLAQSRGFLRGVNLGVEGSNLNTRAAIGGYISERIYLSYGVGLYQPINTLTVRLELMRQLWAEVVSSLHSSADLYYSWELR